MGKPALASREPFPELALELTDQTPLVALGPGGWVENRHVTPRPGGIPLEGRDKIVSVARGKRRAGLGHGQACQDEPDSGEHPAHRLGAVAAAPGHQKTATGKLMG